jgi:hypothetical protein
MRVKCAFCDRMVEEEEVRYRLTVENDIMNFCGLGCMYKAKPLSRLRHRSISSLVLNKTFFELLAIFTGIGGVYYTLFEVGSKALIMDTISVVTAIGAMIIGVEHLRYVKEHRLLGRGVFFVGLLLLTLIVFYVWQHGFR